MRENYRLLNSKKICPERQIFDSRSISLLVKFGIEFWYEILHPMAEVEVLADGFADADLGDVHAHQGE